MSADQPGSPSGQEDPTVRAYRAVFAWEDARLTPYVDSLVDDYREALLHPDDPAAMRYDEAADFLAKALIGRFRAARDALVDDLMAVLQPDMRAELRAYRVEDQFIGQLHGMVDEAGERLASRLRMAAEECREASAFVDKRSAPPIAPRDYRGIDWNADVPSDEALATAFAHSRVAELPALPQAIVSVLDECHEWMNGHAAAAQFMLDLDPALVFYLHRNRLQETSFFVDFFRHPVVSSRLLGAETLTWYEGAPPDSYASIIGPTLGFDLSSSWISVATLAARLSSGSVLGARNTLSDQRVLDLVAGVADAAFESRYSDVLAYYSWRPWASWFFDAHHDQTFFWIDKARGLATVLMVTDSY